MFIILVFCVISFHAWGTLFYAAEPLVMPNMASKNLSQKSCIAIVFWQPQNQVLLKIISWDSSFCVLQHGKTPSKPEARLYLILAIQLRCLQYTPNDLLEQGFPMLASEASETKYFVRCTQGSILSMLPTNLCSKQHFKDESWRSPCQLNGKTSAERGLSNACLGRLRGWAFLNTERKMQKLSEIERSSRKPRSGTLDMAFCPHPTSNQESVKQGLSNGRLCSL